MTNKGILELEVCHRLYIPVVGLLFGWLLQRWADTNVTLAFEDAPAIPPSSREETEYTDVTVDTDDTDDTDDKEDTDDTDDTDDANDTDDTE